METTHSSILTRPQTSRGARACFLILLAVLLIPVCALGAEASRRAAQAKDGPTNLTRMRWHVLGARPLGMFYYRDDAAGLQSLEAHAREMSLLGPQCFRVDADGFVHGQVPAQVLEIARREKVPLMPLLVNPGFDRKIAHAILANPKAQERVVMYLAYLAERDDYAGWQLDLEYIDPADEHLYAQFVELVAARLHRDHRLLSVAVVPRFSDAYPDNRTAEFRTGEWGAPYDFRAIGRAVDFLTLMTYNHHSADSPPGPVAGYAWMKAALDYAVRRVPRSKILLGLPFYGREWVETSKGTTSRTLAYKDVKPRVTNPGPRWDPRWRTTWFEVRQGNGKRTAWFDDSRSLREKLNLMRSYRLRGFAAWRLGVEDPGFWPMAARFEKEEPAIRKARVTGRDARPAAHAGSGRSR